MKPRKTMLVLSALICGALAALYAQVLLAIVDFGNLHPATLFEYAILSLQLLRVVAFFAVPRLRRAGPALLLDLFSLEVYALPFFAVGNLLAGSGVYSDAAFTLFLTWLATVTLVAPSVTIYRTALDVARGGSLKSILPGVAAQAGMLIFVAEAFGHLPATTQGLRGLGELIVGTAGGYGGVGSLANITNITALAVIYVSLALYAAGAGRPQLMVRWNSAIGLYAGATLLVSAWVFLSQSVPGGTLAVFVAPISAVLVALWWLTHES